MKVLVLGASGMLGNAVFRALSARREFETFGTARSASALQGLAHSDRERIQCGVDAENFDALTAIFNRIRPDAVINCVGLVKQLAVSNDALRVIPINALLPHRLADLCTLCGARLIHVSTDCVFNGRKGAYREDDPPDAEDLYGRSKLLGEVVDRGCAVTLRTSIIGRELSTRHGLIEWFLTQQGTVRGFSEAIFSGLTTNELARVIADHVLPYPEMHGLYHVGAEPISKYDLLGIVRNVYKRSTRIISDSRLKIDRSLDSSRFREKTGYKPPSWPVLIDEMHAFGRGAGE